MKLKPFIYGFVAFAIFVLLSVNVFAQQTPTLSGLIFNPPEIIGGYQLIVKFSGVSNANNCYFRFKFRDSPDSTYSSIFPSPNCADYGINVPTTQQPGVYQFQGVACLGAFGTVCSGVRDGFVNVISPYVSAPLPAPAPTSPPALGGIFFQPSQVTAGYQLLVKFTGVTNAEYCRFRFKLREADDSTYSYPAVSQNCADYAINIPTTQQAGWYRFQADACRGSTCSAPQDGYINIVSPYPASTITGVQGYDSATNIYSTTIYANKYLIIYGSFASSGNSVTISGHSGYSITYQSANQINVQLGSTTGAGTVQVTNAYGTSNAVSINIVAPPANIPPPTISPSCQGSTPTAQISWNDAGGTSGGYFIDIDNDNNFENGLWNKRVLSGTSTTAPDGFNPAYGASGAINLNSGSTYHVRVYYFASNRHSPTASFTASNCVVCPTSMPPLEARVSGNRVTLGWQGVQGATSYNIRLEERRVDGTITNARISENRPIGTNCPNDPNTGRPPHYYCVNGLTTQPITDVLVNPGMSYTFWVDPVIPGCGYFNGKTTFSVPAPSSQPDDLTACQGNIIGAFENPYKLCISPRTNLQITPSGSQQYRIRVHTIYNYDGTPQGASTVLSVEKPDGSTVETSPIAIGGSAVVDSIRISVNNIGLLGTSNPYAVVTISLTQPTVPATPLGANEYSRTTGIASGSAIVTCDTGDTRVRCIDEGYGSNHGCDIFGENSCRAWEGYRNNGNANCRIVCRRAALPDLVVESLDRTNPVTVPPGTTVTLIATIKNINPNTNAGTSFAKVHFSGPSGATLTPDFTYRINPLSGLALQINNQNFVVGSVAGTYTAQVCADDGNIITESNDNNNCRTVSVDVTSSAVTPPISTITRIDPPLLGSATYTPLNKFPLEPSITINDQFRGTAANPLVIQQGQTILFKVNARVLLNPPYPVRIYLTKKRASENVWDRVPNAYGDGLGFIQAGQQFQTNRLTELALQPGLYSIYVVMGETTPQLSSSEELFFEIRTTTTTTSSIPSPTISTSCSGSSSTATISWSDAGGTSGGYFIDIDNDNNFENGLWNKRIDSGTNTNVPLGFNPAFGASGSLTLNGGSTYYVRVYYFASNRHSPSASFTALTCPSSPPTGLPRINRVELNNQRIWENGVQVSSVVNVPVIGDYLNIRLIGENFGNDRGSAGALQQVLPESDSMFGQVREGFNFVGNEPCKWDSFSWSNNEIRVRIYPYHTNLLPQGEQSLVLRVRTTSSSLSNLVPLRINVQDSTQPRDAQLCRAKMTYTGTGNYRLCVGELPRLNPTELIFSDNSKAVIGGIYTNNDPPTLGFLRLYQGNLIADSEVTTPPLGQSGGFRILGNSAIFGTVGGYSLIETQGCSRHSFAIRITDIKPALKIFKSGTTSSDFVRGDSIDFKISGAESNKNFEVTILNQQQQAQYTGLRIGDSRTRSDGTFDYTIPSDNTRGWPTGTYYALATIDGSTQTNLAQFTVR